VDSSGATEKIFSRLGCAVAIGRSLTEKQPLKRELARSKRTTLRSPDLEIGDRKTRNLCEADASGYDKIPISTRGHLTSKLPLEKSISTLPPSISGST
jgi:hypothetical protein